MERLCISMTRRARSAHFSCLPRWGTALSLGRAILPPRGPRGVRGIGLVDQLTRVLATAFCANEYLDFDIKRRIISRDTFEEQLTVAMFAVHGGKRLNEVAHVLPPSFSPSIADCGVRALTWVTWRWPHAAVCELLSALRRKVHGPNRFRKLSPCPDISRDDRRDRVARCGMVPFRSANFP